MPELDLQLEPELDIQPVAEELDLQPASIGERIDAALLPDWLKKGDTLAQRGIRRALNLPISRPPTMQELKETALEDITPGPGAVSEEQIMRGLAYLQPTGGIDPTTGERTVGPNVEAFNRAIARNVSPITSPQGMLSLPFFELKPVQIAMAVQMAKQGSEEAQAGLQSLQEGDTPAAIEHFTNAGIGAGGAVALGRGAMRAEPPMKPVGPPEGFEVTRKGVTEPPDLPAYATAQYDPALARGAQAQVRGMGAEDFAARQAVADNAMRFRAMQGVNDLLTAKEAASPPEVPFDPTGPVAETAIEKAMRLTGQSARTAAEIAMEQAPMGPPQLRLPITAPGESMARFRAVEPAQAPPAAAEPAALDAATLRWKGNPLQLRPAYRKANGEIIVGELNQVHADLPGISKMQGQRTDTGASIGYVTPEGKYLDREQAHKAIQAERATVTPSEAATAVAESPEAAAPGEIAPGQEPPAATRPASVGQPAPGQAGTGGGQDIGVAERYAEAELGPGSVVPGTREGPLYWRNEGRAFINAGGDPRMPIRAAKVGAAPPRNVGIVSAEWERLTQLRRQAADILQANPTDPLARQNFDAADAAARGWRKEIQPVFTRAGESLAAIQGEHPVDLTTFDGLHDAAMDANNGQPLTRGQQADLVNRAGKTQTRMKAVDTAIAKRNGVIEKTLPRVKVPTEADMNVMVENMVRRMTPCQ